MLFWAVLTIIGMSLGVILSMAILGRLLEGGHVFEDRDDPREHIVPFLRSRNMRTRRFFRRASGRVWLRAIIAGLVTGGSMFAVSMANQSGVLSLGIPCFVAMGILMVYLVVWWCRRGSSRWEYLWYILTLTIMFFAINAAAGLTARMITDTGWASFIAILPWTFGLFLAAIAAVSAFYYHRRCHLARAADERLSAKDRERSEDRASTYRGAAWLIKIIVIILIVLLLVFRLDLLGVPSPNPQPSPVVATEPATESATTENQLERNWLTYQEVVQKYSWLDWNNFQLQSDGDPNNNLDFGPNRYHDGWTALDYFKDLKEYEQVDLLILIAHIATVDAANDTDMVGNYYNGNDHDWSRTMNSMVRSCLDDETNMMHLLEVFQSFWDNQVRSVRLVHMDDVHDQMRITPYCYDGVPKIVASSTHQSGEILMVTFRTKGGAENDKTVGFRINCCYQPIGVIDLMDLPDTQVEIPPEHTPDTPSSQTPTKPAGGSDPTPTPTPTPTTTPTPPSSGKNPASDPVNQGNADKGGGDNRASNGGGDYQSDPRSNADQPSAVKPQTPAVTPSHQGEATNGNIVDHENKQSYELDPVTDRGSTSSKPPTNSSGDGEFTPTD